MGNGFNLISIENSDDPAYTEIWCYPETVNLEDGTTRPGTLEDDGIRVATDLDDDANFQDWERESGVPWIYVARSFLSTGGYTDSDPTAPVINVLDGLWITLVTREDMTTNAELALNLLISNVRKTTAHKKVSHEFKGRKPVTYFGQAKTQQLEYQIAIHDVDIAQLETLKQLFEADDVLCVRDNFRNKLYGRLVSDVQNLEDTEGAFFGLTFMESYFAESV